MQTTKFLNEKIAKRENIILMLTDVIKTLKKELGKNNDHLDFLLEFIEAKNFDKVDTSKAVILIKNEKIDSEKNGFSNLFTKNFMTYIFSFLNTRDIVKISTLDKKIYQVSKSNLLWQERYFKRYNKLVIIDQKEPHLKVIQNASEKLFDSNNKDFSKNITTMSQINFKKQYFTIQKLEHNWEGENPITKLIPMSDRVTNITLNSKANEFIPVLGDGNAALYKYSAYPNFKVSKVREFIGHSGAIFCSDSYKDLLFTGSYDKTLKIWQISNGKCINTIRPSHDSWVAAVCFDRKAKVLTSSAWDGIIKVYITFI